jgi:translocation and assembly module TamB
VKRLTKLYLGAAVAIGLAGVAMAFFVWVVATPAGSRWLLGTVLPRSGVGFSAQRVEGRILDQLHLSGVRLGLAQQKLEIDSLELRWRPLLLLAGTVAVQDLSLTGVRVQDNAPPAPKPPILAWPRVSGIRQLFEGKIARLRLANLSYRHLQEQPVLVTSVAGSLTWRDSLLSIADLAAIAPAGRLTGSVSAGFNQPSLTADLVISLLQPLAGMNRFSLQLRRGHRTAPEQLAGKIAIAGSAGTRKLLELSGEVGLARTALNLRRLRLTRPGQRGLVTADGSLAFTSRESVLALQVKAAGLNLAPELHVPTELSGTLRFAGALDSYRGEFTLANRAKGWQAATVSAAFQGSAAGVRLAPLTASVLAGTLAGDLDMNWRNGLALRWAISGRNLNPSRVAPDWQGVVNFSATGKLARVGEEPVSGTVSAALLESNLHGQALTGELQADFAGNNLTLARLVLQGRGFDLHASGDLNQRLNLTAQVSDLSRLVPGAAGTLQGEGWLRRHDGQLSGSVAATGSRLASGKTQIAAVQLTARLDQGTGYPMHVSAAVRDLVHDHVSLQAATLAADGTLPRHTVNASLRSAGSEAQLALSAGYKAGVWQGELTRLAGRDGNGPWNLTAPATFSVSTGKFFLAPLALVAGPGERLEVAADLALEPLTGQVRAQWTGLNLARANP